MGSQRVGHNRATEQQQFPSPLHQAALTLDCPGPRTQPGLRSQSFSCGCWSQRARWWRRAAASGHRPRGDVLVGPPAAGDAELALKIQDLHHSVAEASLWQKMKTSRPCCVCHSSSKHVGYPERKGRPRNRTCQRDAKLARCFLQPSSARVFFSFLSVQMDSLDTECFDW